MFKTYRQRILPIISSLRLREVVTFRRIVLFVREIPS